MFGRSQTVNQNKQKSVLNGRVRNRDLECNRGLPIFGGPRTTGPKIHARFQTRWLLKVALGALNCFPDGPILMPACDFLRSSQPAQDKVPQVPFLAIYKSVTDQACSVHIRGYWPRFICVFIDLDFVSFP